MNRPQPIKKMIEIVKKLPGVGPKMSYVLVIIY